MRYSECRLLQWKQRKKQHFSTTLNATLYKWLNAAKALLVQFLFMPPMVPLTGSAVKGGSMTTGPFDKASFWPRINDYLGL